MKLGRKVILFLGLKDCIHNHRLVLPSMVMGIISILMYLFITVFVKNLSLIDIPISIFMFIIGFVFYFGLNEA